MALRPAPGPAATHTQQDGSDPGTEGSRRPALPDAKTLRQGEEGLRLLHQSREAFINSLRNTGLTYAEAKTKYDNCLDDQEVQLHDMLEKMRYAERMHQYILHRIALQQSQDAAALRPEQAAAPA